MNHDIVNLHPDPATPEVQICLEHQAQKVIVTHKKGEDCPLCVAEARVKEERLEFIRMENAWREECDKWKRKLYAADQANDE